MVNILTDSCSDLTAEIRRHYDIHVVPLKVFINNQTYLDGVNITNADLFRLVEETGTLPKTSAPSVAEMVEFFKSIPGDHLFICIGSKLSATYQSAVLAAQEVTDRKIRLVDSANLSTGIGLLVLMAAELRDQGLSLDEIAASIEETVPKVHTSFVIDRLDYLYKGGRCSAMQNIVGSLLKIRPIIEVQPDGTLGVKDRSRGARRKALEAMLEDFRLHAAELNPRRVFVTHTTCEEDAEFLKQAILEIAPVEEVLITTAGSTIASHCGPKTIGILYLTR